MTVQMTKRAAASYPGRVKERFKENKSVINNIRFKRTSAAFIGLPILLTVIAEPKLGLQSIALSLTTLLILSTNDKNIKQNMLNGVKGSLDTLTGKNFNGKATHYHHKKDLQPNI